MYTYIKASKKLIPQLRQQKGAHLLPLKRTYKPELHRIKFSFSVYFKNKEN